MEELKTAVRNPNGTARPSVLFDSPRAVAGHLEDRGGAEDGTAVDTPGTRRHSGVFLAMVEPLSTIFRRQPE